MDREEGEGANPDQAGNDPVDAGDERGECEGGEEYRDGSSPVPGARPG